MAKTWNYPFAFGSVEEGNRARALTSPRLTLPAFRLFIHPCSHVGHIFRDFHPYSFLGKDSHGLNTLRTVMVWMDDYARYFFLHRSDLRNRTKDVDVSARIQLKHQLGCKSFRWYLENVYTEKKFIYDQNVIAYGQVRNPITNLCLDNLNRAEDSKHEIGSCLLGRSSLSCVLTVCFRQESTSALLPDWTSGQIKCSASR